MVDIYPLPVLCCAGHDLHVAELESQCSNSIASEPVLWRHSKHCSPYPVRVHAYFTRFSAETSQSPIKVLSSGRPVRPVGSVQPLLYIHVISNNHTQYTTGGVKQKIVSWLSYLRARNINDWLILMIDADPPSNAPKVWSKPDVLQKIKQDLNLPSVDHQFQRIPDRRAVDEKTFSDAWITLMRSLRRTILEVCHRTMQDYESHIRLLEEAQGSSGWDFFEYFNRKEELAQLYLLVGGYEDALHEYFEVDSLFTTALSNATSQDHVPTWLDSLIRKSNDCSRTLLSRFPIVNLTTNSPQAQAVRQRNAHLFTLRAYWLSREIALLNALDWWHEIPARALFHISSTVEQSRLLKLSLPPELLLSWAFLCSISCLECMFELRKGLTKSSGVTESITNVLAVAFGLAGKHSTQSSTHHRRHDFIVGDSALTGAKMCFPLDNVLLRITETLNPLAAPLAAIVDGIYATITATSTLIGNAPILTTATRANAQLVELWLLAFFQLSYLGKLMSLWYPVGSDVLGNTTVIQTVKASLSDCLSSADVSQVTYSQSVHKHLATLLSSRAVYAETFTAMAQTLIGLLRLIDHPRKSVYVSAQLAEFLSRSKTAPEAFDLYAVVLSVYLREGWTTLSARTYLQFACSLRPYVQEIRLHTVTLATLLQSHKHALLRYFDCCIALSSTSQSDLNVAINSLFGTTNSFLKSTDPVADDPALTVADLASTDFWWLEALHTQKAFADDLTVDATFAHSAPFQIESFELNEACNDGFQTIILRIKVVAPVMCAVRISVTAAVPSPDDWHSIMNYGVHYDRKYNIQKRLSNLSSIDLCQTTPSLSSSEFLSATDLRRLTFAYQSAHLLRPEGDTLRPSSELSNRPRMNSLLPPNEIKRKQSILDVAASLATRPAWKSQDQLAVGEMADDPDFPSSRRASHVPDTDQSGCVSAPHPLALLSVDSHRTGMRRACSISGPCGNSSRSSHHIDSQVRGGFSHRPSLITLDSDVGGLFLKLCSQSPSEIHTNLMFTTTSPGLSLIVLKPGSNEIRLSAKSAGFLIPKAVNVGIVQRIVADRTLTEDTTTFNESSPTLFTLVYHVQRSHFSTSWNNRKVLDSLLPNLRLTTWSSGYCSPVHAILGLRQMIPVEIQFGRLGLNVQTGSSVHLYRIVPKPTSHGISTFPTSQSIGRNLKVVNDYTVISSPTALCDTGVGYVEHQSLECSFHHQDGPITLIGFHENGDSTVDQPTAVVRPHSLIKLARPLWLSSFGDTDEFVLSMPDGHLCRLPVRVLRPLALNLTVHTSQRTDTVLFGIRIACMDMSTPADPASPIGMQTIDPITFRLSDFDLRVAAPGNPTRTNITHSKSTRSFPITTSQDPANLQIPVPKPKEKLQSDLTKGEQTSCESCDFISGSCLDPQCVEAVVNQLCPVTLLFRFQFAEFHPFVSSVIERFGEPPVARFQCTFKRVDDPAYESQLIFSRRISPIRQTMTARNPSTNILVTRDRRERVAT